MLEHGAYQEAIKNMKHGCKDGNQLDFNHFNGLQRSKPKVLGVCYIFSIRVPILILFSEYG